MVARIQYADVAQLAEQLTCNQQVNGSSPFIGFMGGFPSGQRGQTVNLLAQLGERLPYKQDVIGSSPITPIFLLTVLGRFFYCGISSLESKIILCRFSKSK